MAFAPGCQYLGSAHEGRTHRCTTGVLWLEPDGKLRAHLDHATGAIVHRSLPILDPQRVISHHTCWMKNLARKYAAKTRCHAVITITKHADVNVISDPI